MGLFTILLIALGLTFDTFAVSVSTGISVKNIRFLQAFRVALIFAVFQASMPIIGWFGTIQIKDLIRDYDHWIATGLLWFLGIKMIKEAFSQHEETSYRNPLNTKHVITLAIATSIDALAVGVSFACLDVNMPKAIFMIGFATFMVAMLGMLLGKKAGEFIGKRAEFVGGLILIVIGIKILIEHLS